MNRTSVGLTMLASTVFWSQAALAANVGFGSSIGGAVRAAPVVAPVSSGVPFAGGVSPSFSGAGSGGAFTPQASFSPFTNPNAAGLNLFDTSGFNQFGTNSIGFSQFGTTNQGFTQSTIQGLNPAGNFAVPNSTGVPFLNGPGISPVQPTFTVTTTTGNILNQNNNGITNPNLFNQAAVAASLFSNNGLFGRPFGFGNGWGYVPPPYYAAPMLAPRYAYSRPQTVVVAPPMGGANPYQLPGFEERRRLPRNQVDTIYTVPVRVPSSTGLASAGTRTFARVFNRCDVNQRAVKAKKRVSKRFWKKTSCGGS